MSSIRLPSSLQHRSSRPHHASHSHTHSSLTSGLYSSEEAIILSIGSRVFRAGFAGEAHPRCVLPYRADFWRRVGERAERWYLMRDGARIMQKELGGGEIFSEVGNGERNAWEERYKQLTKAPPESPSDAGSTVVPLGPAGARDTLEEDVWTELLERVLREAFEKYLLVDARTRKVFLGVKVGTDMRRVKAMVKVLLVHVQVPAVAVFPESVFAVVATGLKAGLVVDIGWEETVIEAVFDMRPVRGVGPGVRSFRAGKFLRQKTKEMLEKEAGTKLKDSEVEEVVARMLWCKRAAHSWQDIDDDPIKRIPYPSPTRPISLPFSAFSQPVEQTFFAPIDPSVSGDPRLPVLKHDQEDEPPIPNRIYEALLGLPIDVRAEVLSRITFVGAASKIPGLQARIMRELQRIVYFRKWDKIQLPKSLRGKRKGKKRRSMNGDEEEDEDESETPTQEDPDSEFLKPVINPDSEEVYQWRVKVPEGKEGEGKDGYPAGALRAVKGLGVWAGGSLLACAKVQGLFEIEREKYTQSIAQGGDGLGGIINAF